MFNMLKTPKALSLPFLHVEGHCYDDYSYFYSSSCSRSHSYTPTNPTTPTSPITSTTDTTDTTPTTTTTTTTTTTIGCSGFSKRRHRMQKQGAATLAGRTLPRTCGSDGNRSASAGRSLWTERSCSWYSYSAQALLYSPSTSLPPRQNYSNEPLQRTYAAERTASWPVSGNITNLESFKSAKGKVSSTSLHAIHQCGQQPGCTHSIIKPCLWVSAEEEAPPFHRNS